MTFPSVASEASSQQDTDTTTHTVTMPSGVAAGNLLVAAVAFDARPSVSGGTMFDNWVQLVNTAHSGDLCALRVYYKTADGTEGASQTLTTGTAECSSHHVWRITGQASTVPEAAIFQGTTGTSLDPPSLNPTGWDVDDTLWLALSSSDDGAITVTGFPTSYTGTGQVNADSSADGVTLGYARRDNATASEDPSAFTVSATTAFCTATIAIRPQPDYPFLQAEGTQPANVTTGNLTVALPAHQADDILVAIVAIWAPNTAGSLAAIPTPTDWTKQAAVNFPATPDGEIAFFWRRATASGTTDPTFTRGASWDTGTDTAYGGRAFVVRGCIATGDPWDEFDPTAALTGANGAVDAVTVSAAKRTVIQFLGKTDDFVTAPTISGWTAGTQTEQVAGTDTSFGTFRKENVSASTSADASTVEAVAQGAYVFFGVSFKPPDTGTNASAGNASGAGSAPTSSTSVAPSAALAAGAGTAPTATPNVQPAAGAASGSGAAFPAGTSATTAAGAATGAGTAPGASASVAANAGVASGSGDALEATVSTGGPATNAPAGLAAGAGDVLAATASISPSAGEAQGTGTALGATSAVSASAGVASGTGAANAASPSVTASAGVAASSGTALGATGLGANQAAAGAAEGAGTASPATPGVAPTAGLAAASGAANQAATTIAGTAGVAEGAGAAQTGSVAVSAHAGAAEGAGTGEQATASTATQTQAPADLAEGTGTAGQPSTSVAATSGVATGSGAGLTAVGSVAPTAGVAAAAGSALEASVSAVPVVSALAGVGEAAGSAGQVSAAVAASAGLAAGAGTAEAPGSSSSAGAGVATGVGTTWPATVSLTARYTVLISAGGPWPAGTIDDPDAPSANGTVGPGTQGQATIDDPEPVTANAVMVSL